MVNDTNYINGNREGNDVLVVSQTGRGDFKSIAKAIAAAPAGATIKIDSGFYEEALVVSKPLTLIGDPNGLAVVTNSDFALLTVKSTELKVQNLAMVAGLRLPSIDIQAAILEFQGSILWTLDPFLKLSNPSLMPARALVSESFLGTCMRGLLTINKLLSDLLRPVDTRPEEAREPSPNGGPNAEPQGGPPDVVLRSGARLAGAGSFIGMASVLGTARSTVTFADCRLAYATVTSCEDSEVHFSGCERFGEPWKPRVYIRRGRFSDTFPQKNPAPDLIKREMEATLQTRAMELKRANGHTANLTLTARSNAGLIQTNNTNLE